MHALVAYSSVSNSTRNLKRIASPIKFMNWAKLKKRVTWPWPRPLGGSMSSQDYLVYSTCVQNLATLASAVPEIWLRASKLKMCQVTPITPILWVV